MIMKKTDVRRDALLQASNGAIVATVSNNTKALGYIGFGYINDSAITLTGHCSDILFKIDRVVGSGAERHVQDVDAGAQGLREDAVA